MSTEHLGTPENLPDLWGEGATFAFSGIDGPTDSSAGFVASLAADRYSLLLHTPTRRILGIRLPMLANPLLVSGDLILVETSTDELFMTYSAWHTIVGLAPKGTGMRLVLEDQTVSEVDGGFHISRDPHGRDVLALVVRGGQFALSYGTNEQEARQRADEGLCTDLNELVQHRLVPYENVPTLEDAGRDRLLKKCLSVMKANTCAGEAKFRTRWVMRHRIEDRQQSVWTAVLYSFAMNRLDGELAWDALRCVLDSQLPDGMIPGRSDSRGGHSTGVHPPLLTWAVWENFQRTGERKRLGYAYEKLEDYLDFDSEHRDGNRNSLLEWRSDVDHRSENSGTARSPGLNLDAPLDAVDFSVYAANDMKHLSKMANVLGDNSSAKYWLDKSSFISQQVHTLLWDPGRGFYFDRGMNGQFCDVMSVSGLLPLLLDDLPENRVEDLVRHLGDTRHFGSTMPLASASLSSPATDGWRGAVSPAINYLIWVGLLRQGRAAEAVWLKERTLDHVQKHYERSGLLFDRYDPHDMVAPAQLPGVVRDSAATAAAVAALLMR